MPVSRLWLIALSCIAMRAGAQSPESLDLSAVGKDPRWKVAGRTTSIVDAKGKHALKIGEGQGMGTVWLDGYDFGNGVIELDMLGRSQPVQAFSASRSVWWMRRRTTRCPCGHSTFAGLNR